MDEKAREEKKHYGSLREHARIYGAVEAITEACEKEEAAMIDMDDSLPFGRDLPL